MQKSILTHLMVRHYPPWAVRCFQTVKIRSLFISVSHLLYVVCIPSDTPPWPSSHALHTYIPLSQPWQPQKPGGLLCGAQPYTLWVKRHLVFCLVGVHYSETSILSLSHDLLDTSVYPTSTLRSTKDRAPSP